MIFSLFQHETKENGKRRQERSEMDYQSEVLGGVVVRWTGNLAVQVFFSFPCPGPLRLLWHLVFLTVISVEEEKLSSTLLSSTATACKLNWQRQKTEGRAYEFLLMLIFPILHAWEFTEKKWKLEKAIRLESLYIILTKFDKL